MIHFKSPREIKKMRRAGRLLASVFVELFHYVKPGVVTIDLDRMAEALIRAGDARPAFKGYKGNCEVGFPGTLCISIDKEIVHGIPSARRLKEGQIVGIDAGLELDGWYADMARSFLIGEVDEVRRKLWRVTREALYRGIAEARSGNRISDIGAAIQRCAEENGFSVIRDLVGHGIGSQLHEDPAVPNYTADNAQRIVMRKGMTIAIEPMIAAGDWNIRVLNDGWTAVTVDGSPTGHFEHTVLITDGDPEVLTLLDDGSDPWFYGETLRKE